VTLDLSRFTTTKDSRMRDEWEAFREHDVVFLLCIDKPDAEAQNRLREYESARVSGGARKNSRDSQAEMLDFASMFGVRYVRGGEVFEYRDEADVVLNDPSRPDERGGKRTGHIRHLRLRLDAGQYLSDMASGNACYEGLNLLVRRGGKENNFKAVLQTIRQLINTAAVGRAIPPWMHDVFLGYGDPAKATYRYAEQRQRGR
jgi:intron-binding protein aquarius